MSSLSRAKQSNNAASHPGELSPQLLTLWNIVAAVYATINKIVKVHVVHLTGSTSAEDIINDIITSVPFKLLMRKK